MSMSLTDFVCRRCRNRVVAVFLLILANGLGVYGAAYAIHTMTSAKDDSDRSKMIEYLNTGPGGGYVGSKVCGKCHVAIYKEYMRTDMARSMVLPSQCQELKKLSTPVTVFDKNLNRYFQVFRRGTNFYQSEYALASDGKKIFQQTEKIAYVMGADENGVGFVVQRGSYLFEAPLAFYAKTKSWALSPGYESHDFGFTRPITADCVSCHSGLPQPVFNRKGLFKKPPFRELGIGCEDCHGPGETHVVALLMGIPPTGKIDPTIVNPADLPAWRADNICMSCHEEGDARVLQPGKEYGEFRPGNPLINTVAIFSQPLSPGSENKLPLLGYYSELRLSQCFRGSHGRISCVTCHNPHQQLPKKAAMAYYRSRCLTCHTINSCKVPLRVRLHESISDNCVECHMPKQAVQLFSHSVATNHLILARPDEPLPKFASQPGSSRLVCVDAQGKSNAHISPVVLLDAYRQILMSNPTPGYKKRYAQLLVQAAKTNPNNIIVLRALANRDIQKKTLQGAKEAIQYLDRVVAMKSSAPDDRFALGEELALTGQTAQGIAIIRKAVPMDPYNPLGYEGLAMTYLVAGKFDDAFKVLHQGLDLFPGNRMLRIMLNKASEAESSPSR